jgi:hypothetical protein
MRSLLSRLLPIILFLTIILVPLGIVQPAVALINSSSSQTAACQGINVDQDSNACTADGDSASGLGGIIKDVLDILSIVVGVAAIIMIIIGGFRYVLSGGDSNSTSGAKNTIIFAIVGLVIAVLAQVLVQFVLAKTAGK